MREVIQMIGSLLPSKKNKDHQIWMLTGGRSIIYSGVSKFTKFI